MGRVKQKLYMLFNNSKNAYNLQRNALKVILFVLIRFLLIISLLMLLRHLYTVLIPNVFSKRWIERLEKGFWHRQVPRF